MARQVCDTSLMRFLRFVRALALLLCVVVAASACSATETVTINDATIANATATAQRNAAGPTEPTPTVESTTAVATTDAAASDGNRATTTTPTPTPVASDDSDGTGTSNVADGRACSYAGVDSFGDMQIEIAFISPLPEQSDATVDYEVIARGGAVLASSTHFIEELQSGEAVRVTVDTVTDAPTGSDGASGITCRILEIEPLLFGFNAFEPQPGDSCTFAEVDSFGDIQVQIDVVSPLDDTAELAIDYALRGPDGVRFADDVTFTDSVGAGQLWSGAADTLTEFPDWVNESTFSCEILSIQEF